MDRRDFNELFRKMVAVKLQKCFVDYETTSFLNPLRDFILVYMYFV